ncbi:phosphoribosylanthranilate isomerase [Flagellimonas hymeniacidonis]|uniref:N-(5'-phosphoribosyl)anthranilate isomerase n=1 Tax=Flagellimonas hymeniacidonis TaxID=2603628 RepID=A0A5C8V3U7_9FLAO|nr:phosphoribosylanthranilate isomerase [Flagellimonas hymeniacidonis]TXN36744.1 phosphoribosylanthranilate isomerase [Flagellimonas hymeniacidonis]
MKLKVCGMNHNPKEVAQLQPDYLGFIFWKPSTRYFDGNMPELPKSIKKVGVFVDAFVEEVLQKVKKYSLDALQLHGTESPEYCSNLIQAQVDIIKVFSIKDDFDFSVLEAYEASCDYFMFDTKGKLPGGNGYVFDWSILKEYPSSKPYFLSGGIGLNEIDSLLAFLESPASKQCYAIDVNSKFEIEPGLKNIKQLREFKKLLSNNFQFNTDNS